MAEEKVIESLVIELKAAFEPLRQGLQQAQGHLASFGKDAKGHLQVFEEAALGAAAAATALVAPLAAGAVAFGKFKAVMNSVETNSGATAEQLANLTDKAIELGAETAFSALEAAHGFDELTKAGFEVQEQMESIDGVLDLAAAGQLAVGEAAEDAAGILRGYNLEAKESGRVADELAQAANTSAVSVRDLAESQKYIAPIATSSNQSLSEMNGILAALGNQMIKGGQAGTSIRSVLVALQRPSGDAAKIMYDLGVSIQDTHGRMLPLSDVINQLREKTAKWTETQRANAIATIFGQESLSAVMALLNLAPGKLETFIQAQERSTGAAKRMAEGLQKGPNYELEQLKGSLETVAIKFGSTLAPALERTYSLLTKLVNVLGSLPGPVRALATAVALLAASFLALVAAAGGFVALLPTLINGFKALGIAWAATLTGMEAALPVLGMLSLAFITLAPLIYPIVQAFNDMTSAIDDAADKTQKFVDASAKLMKDGETAWKKFQQGGKLTADEARTATLFLRQLAVEAENPETAKRMRERADAMQKIYDAAKAGGAVKRGTAIQLTPDQQEAERKKQIQAQKQDAQELLQLDLARYEANKNGIAGQIKAYEAYRDRLKKIAGATRDVAAVEFKIASLRTQQSEDARDKKVKDLRFELEKALVINEKFKGGIAGQIDLYQDYLEALRKVPDTLDEQRRVQLQILGLQNQQADAARQLHRQQMETLKGLMDGLAKVFDTTRVDDLRAKVGALKSDIAKMQATPGADPAEIIRQQRELSTTERDLKRAERDQSAAGPAFLANNFETIAKLPTIIDGTIKAFDELRPPLVEASRGVWELAKGFGGGFMSFLQALGSLNFGAIGGMLQGLLAGALPAIGGALSGLAAAIIPLLPIVAAVVLAFAVLQQMWQSNAGGIQEAISNIMGALGFLWEAILGFVSPLSELLGGLFAFVGNGLAVVISVVGGIISGFTQLVGWVWNMITSFGPLKWIIDGVVWIFGQLWGALATFIEFITFGKVKLKGKGDNAKEAQAGETKAIEEDRSFNAQLSALNLPDRIGSAIKTGMADALGNITSFNPLPVQDMSRANALFSQGPTGRWFVSQETRATIDLNLKGDVDSDKLIAAVQDPQVRAAISDAVGRENATINLVPKFA